MKVFLFSSGFHEYIIELSNSMTNYASVTLCIPNKNISKKHHSLINNKVNIETFYFVDYKSIRDKIKMLNDIRKILKINKPDIIHIQAHGLPNFYCLFPFIINRNIINTIHDVRPHTGDKLSKRNIINNYIINKLTKHVIVHGKEQKKEAIRRLNLSAEKISVINHGNLAIYKNWRDKEVNKDMFTFLFFGRIWPYKGLKYFINAANLLAERNDKVKFIIAGKGENFKKYEKLIQQKEKFEIKNYRISELEIDELFQKSRIVVLPYTDATQSGVIPIAFSYENLVISTNVGSLPEIVIHKKTGLICEPKNTKDLFNKMNYSINNIEEIDVIIKNSKKLTKTSLNWDNIAEKTYKIYQKIYKPK
ncbi:MAG: hypothetical protein CL853_05855 [Crocinitomicaceae bacterium]|nr:hypothetical protein [Crocinitomicaceae bacterium]|tara:strand:- start:1022 stop:2110 length:1089 start_codon:yes stop_codon:yes gene_type:complete